MIKTWILAGVVLLAGCGSTSTVVVNAPGLTVSPSALAFGMVPLGTSSVTQSVTLGSTGGTLTVGTPVISGVNASSFLVSSNCPNVLIKGSTCAVTVVFAPAASGALNGVLSIASNAAGTPALISLSGTGTASGPVVSLSATALTFATLPVGMATTQTVTLSNIGTSTLQISGFTLTGVNVSSFALSGPCFTSSMIAAGAACTLTVTYAPTVAGPVSAAVNIVDNGMNSPQVITLASK